MLFLTGDIHGNPDRLSFANFPEGKSLTKEDYVVVCGDFGLVWDYRGENRQEKNWLDWLEEKPFTTLFVDGNHENFDRLYKYPLEEWNGGKVHKVRPSVIHLMRGQVYELDGKKVFAFGGASSHDIHHGILDGNDPSWKEKAKRLEKEGKYFYRVNGISWWKEEMPSKEEMEEGLRNLSLHGNKVDVVLSHCAPTSTQILLGGSRYKADALTDYLEEVRSRIEYEKWYFGHYHTETQINMQETCLYTIITEHRERFSFQRCWKDVKEEETLDNWMDLE